MAREDIERLQQKIAKDPDSKLFVPLAEEYKKADMIDEAINVLIQGLEKQPNYLSARVSLGKIYMGKGFLNEAKDEFQKVILVIPDNLYAHKKLAEIYQELGERDNALKELHIVLNLNPADEWAVSNLSAFEQETQRIPEEPPGQAITEPEEFLHSDIKHAETPERTPDESSAATEDEEPAETALQATLGKEQQEVVEEQVAEPPQEEEASSFQDTVKPVQATPDAEDFIKQGKYREAMHIYKAILSEDPENIQVLQRIAELKALLKILGKDDEAHILQLERFLEGIKKRGKEFLAKPEDTGGISG